MGFFAWLLGRKRKVLMPAPKNICPNCWGSQEWDKKYYALAKDKQIDVNNHAANHAFIQDFVIHHLDGITLKNRKDFKECSSCKARYHP